MQTMRMDGLLPVVVKCERVEAAAAASVVAMHAGTVQVPRDSSQLDGSRAQCIHHFAQQRPAFEPIAPICRPPRSSEKSREALGEAPANAFSAFARRFAGFPRRLLASIVRGSRGSLSRVARVVRATLPIRRAARAPRARVAGRRHRALLPTCLRDRRTVGLPNRLVGVPATLVSMLLATGYIALRYL